MSFLETLQAYTASDSSDEALKLLEDFKEEYGDGTVLTQKDVDNAVKEKDDEWRKKYKERFFNTNKNEENKELENDETTEENKDEELKVYTDTEIVKDMMKELRY